MQALAASQWGVWAYPAVLPEVLGTQIAEALGSPRLHPLCPLGLPLLVDASIGQLQVFWAGGPLACPGVLRNGAQPSVYGQIWDKFGPFVEVSCLLSIFSAASNTYPMSALCQTLSWAFMTL